MLELTFTADSAAALKADVLQWVRELGVDPAQIEQTMTVPAAPAPVTPISVTPASVPAVSVTPVPMPAAPVMSPPVMPMQTAPTSMTPGPASPIAASATPAPTPVPTAAPTYTQEELMTAGARLMSTVGMPVMQSLMESFGVQAIHQLRPEQYGAFAQALRDLGAQL